MKKLNDKNKPVIYQAKSGEIKLRGDFDKNMIFAIGDASKNTAKFGKFKIKKESSSSAGVRRVKAVFVEE